MINPARPLYSVFAAFVGAVLVSQAAAPVQAFPPLKAETSAGWSQYTAATEQRIATELKSTDRFLALDFTSTGIGERQAVLHGEMPVAQMFSTKANGKTIDVPDAWVHHWRGAVLLPKARLADVLRELQVRVPGAGQGDVLASKILEPAPAMRVYLKIHRSKVSFTFVYNTEHLVTFTPRDATHGSSTSVAVKIAELANAGTPDERELAPGKDYGFLWRLNAYWRYLQVPEGVIAECESVSLSREVGFPFGTIGGIVARGEARESMERALVNLRAFFATPVRTRPAWSPAR
jgi:hypothetical protein